MSDEKKTTKNQNWKFDRLEKWFISISGALIVFTIFAPVLFTKCSFGATFGEETGQIGDTIGGVMNPFITLAGVLITFLAFYIQYKANQSQIKQFEESFKESKRVNKIQFEQTEKGLAQNRIQFERSLKESEKQEKRKEQLDSYYHLSLLEKNLDVVIKVSESICDYIKEYQDQHKQDKLFSYLLKRITLDSFNRILELNKLEIYKGFRTFFSEKEEWIDIYVRLYNNIEFIKAKLEEIYNVDNYNKKHIYDAKGKIAIDIKAFVDKSKEFIDSYNNNTVIKVELISLKGKYFEILQKQENNEHDIKKIKLEITDVFLERIENFKIDNDDSLKFMKDKAEAIKINVRSLQLFIYDIVMKIEKEYNNLLENIDELKLIKSFITTELKEVDIKKLPKEL